MTCCTARALVVPMLLPDIVLADIVLIEFAAGLD